MRIGNARFRAAVLLLLASIAGGFAGVALDRSLGRASDAHGDLEGVRRSSDRGEGAGRSFDRGALRRRLAQQLTDELDLSVAQQAAVDEILQKRQRAVDDLSREVEPRFRVLVSGTRDDIDRILTPEQRERFRSIRIERQDGSSRLPR